MLKFEICVDSIEGVRAAQVTGAHRVELCANLLEGGTTPSIGMIRRARTITGIALHVIVRPRGGDFLYDPEEIEVMVADIEAAEDEGVDGVVIGALLANGQIDRATTAKLIDAARPMAVTFHRAFDMACDPFAALETLVELGVERVLTSGQEASALEGLPLITELNRQAGDRIIVMPGGAIAPHNVARIVRESGVRELHFAAREAIESKMAFRRAHVFMGGELRTQEFERHVTSVARLRATMDAALHEVK